MNQLLCFPHDYVIIDIEMTGLIPEKDSIIEIAGLRVIQDKITDTFSSLICPEEYTLKEEITQLTGITAKMLTDAPHFPEIKEALTQFIENLPLVGHNIPMDIRFLNKTMQEHGYLPFDNDYADTLPLSQKLFPEFIHHRLTDIALYYGISTKGAHRAINDCYITKECFDKMRETMKRSFPSEESFSKSFTCTGKRLKAEHIQAFFPNPQKTDEDFSEKSLPNPVKNKVFVFTGILKQMSRREAMLFVASLGGINEDKLTTKVDYLIIGRKETEITNKDILSGKEKKALRYRQEGYPIQLLTEADFYALIKGVPQNNG